ncbi:MAG: carbohydrate-binding family 9-like protein [Planctomycetota bacterium]
MTDQPAIFCHHVGAFATVGLFMLLTACASPLSERVMVAHQITAPISLDGLADEPDWVLAQIYPLAVPEAVGSSEMPQESGVVRLCWDHDALYLHFTLTDLDVVQENDADQQHHYRTGDVVEVFIKPQDQPHYWELYVTPNGRRTTFFYPGGGRRRLPSSLTAAPPIHNAEVQLNGSLNDWSDTDTGWSAEVRIPLTALASQGSTPGPTQDWAILAARYNHGRHLTDIELSSAPRLPARQFHAYPAWARLVINLPHDSAPVRAR